MNSFDIESVQFLKPDNTEELLAGYKNLERIVPSVFSDKNTTKNNIVFSIEKYQLTILATEFGIGTLDLPQITKQRLLLPYSINSTRRVILLIKSVVSETKSDLINKLRKHPVRTQSIETD